MSRYLYNVRRSWYTVLGWNRWHPYGISTKGR